MKVLWLVNAIFPYPAEKLGLEKSCFGGWAHSLYESIKNTANYSFCIVATYSGQNLEKFTQENTTYYLIPNKKENVYNPELKKYWQKIIEDFKPDIVHLHGIEYPKSLPLIEMYPNLNYVASIQGIINSCKRVCYANLKFSTLVKNLTIRDFLKPTTGYLMERDYAKRAIYERKIIESIKNVIGRTTWDKAMCLALNPDINYYHCEENLRSCFYTDEWNYQDALKHTIFFSQAQSMIKGFYLMIEALNILKKKYPDVKVVVAGNNLFKKDTLKDKLKKQSYTKYLEKLVKKYNLEDNIEFTGFLDAQEYKEKLIKSHVYVQASSIENSSNSLGEAMILGVPCVASNVGGTSDMLIDKKEGFLYPYTEPELLAYYISKYFEDPKLCADLGQNARSHALKRHNWEENAKTTIEIYESIVNK